MIWSIAPLVVTVVSAAIWPDPSAAFVSGFSLCAFMANWLEQN